MHPRIPGRKFPECPSLNAICLQSIPGSGHHPYPLQAPRPKPLMPLTAKLTFTQASSPDDSLFSSQLQPVAVPPHTLPGLTLEGHGSPAPSSIRRALCLSPAHLKALPRVQSLLEAGGPGRRLRFLQVICQPSTSSQGCWPEGEPVYGGQRQAATQEPPVLVPRGLLFVSLWSCTVELCNFCVFMELLPAPPLLSSLPTVPGPCTLPTAPPGLASSPSSGWPTEAGTRGFPHSPHHRVMAH